MTMIRWEVSGWSSDKKSANSNWRINKYIVSYSDSRPQNLLCVCVCLPVRWLIFCLLLETCCISFSVIYMLDGRWRDEVCGVGGGG